MAQTSDLHSLKDAGAEAESSNALGRSCGGAGAIGSPPWSPPEQRQQPGLRLPSSPPLSGLGLHRLALSRQSSCPQPVTQALCSGESAESDVSLDPSSLSDHGSRNHTDTNAGATAFGGSTAASKSITAAALDGAEAGSMQIKLPRTGVRRRGKRGKGKSKQMAAVAAAAMAGHQSYSAQLVAEQLQAMSGMSLMSIHAQAQAHANMLALKNARNTQIVSGSSNAFGMFQEMGTLGQPPLPPPLPAQHSGPGFHPFSGSGGAGSMPAVPMPPPIMRQRSAPSSFHGSNNIQMQTIMVPVPIQVPVHVATTNFALQQQLHQHQQQLQMSQFGGAGFGVGMPTSIPMVIPQALPAPGLHFQPPLPVHPPAMPSPLQRQTSSPAHLPMHMMPGQLQPPLPSMAPPPLPSESSAATAARSIHKHAEDNFSASPAWTYGGGGGLLHHHPLMQSSLSASRPSDASGHGLPLTHAGRSTSATASTPAPQMLGFAGELSLLSLVAGASACNGAHSASTSHPQQGSGTAASPALLHSRAPSTASASNSATAAPFPVPAASSGHSTQLFPPSWSRFNSSPGLSVPMQRSQSVGSASWSTAVATSASASLAYSVLPGVHMQQQKPVSPAPATMGADVATMPSSNSGRNPQAGAQSGTSPGMSSAPASAAATSSLPPPLQGNHRRHHRLSRLLSSDTAVVYFSDTDSNQDSVSDGGSADSADGRVPVDLSDLYGVLTCLDAAKDQDTQ